MQRETFKRLTNSSKSMFVAGIVAAIWSSSMFASSPWHAKANFYSAFFTSIVSVRKAQQQAYILRRFLPCSNTNKADNANAIRVQFAINTGSVATQEDVWKVDFWKQVRWNTSLLFLNLAVIFLCSGLLCMVLQAADAVGWKWGEDSTKVSLCSPGSHILQYLTLPQIALCVIVVSALCAGHYIYNGFDIYRDYSKKDV